MEKDKRYEFGRYMFFNDRVKTFKDLFEYIPKTTVAHDLKMNNMRFNDLIDNPSKFVLMDIFKLADLFEIDRMEFIAWAVKAPEVPPKPAPQKKKK